MNKKEELIIRAIASNPCAKCPTLKGIIFGTDPESYDNIHNPEIVEDEINRGCRLHCPWHKSYCRVYPLEQKYAHKCHQNGIRPEIHLHQKYVEYETESIC